MLPQDTTDKLERPEVIPPETCTMCKTAPFEKFPSVTLEIMDRDVIRAKELPHCKSSGRSTYSTGAAGVSLLHALITGRRHAHFQNS